METFDLTTEPWLPLVRPDGTTTEVGLREALANAHEYRELCDQSPLVTLALYRLLLALAHRVYGPVTRRSWLDLWGAGAFPAGPLDAYLGRWRGRFDLFDREYPFYQSRLCPIDPDDPTNEDAGPSSVLAAELAGGNNVTLFDHTSEAHFRGLTPAAAARYLVARQAFSLSSGKSPCRYPHTTDSPLSQVRCCAMPVGVSLFRSLMLNLTPPDFAAVGNLGVPFWESEAIPVTARPRRPDGLLDYLTWQARTIRLARPEADGLVRHLGFLQGHAASLENFFEPMGLYRVHEEAGRLPIRLVEERAVWRDSSALFQLNVDGSDWRPAAIRWLASLEIRGAIERQPMDLMVIGACTKKADITFWRRESMPLPLAYLDNVELVSRLARSLEQCEIGASAVKEAIRAFGQRHLDAVNDPPKPDRTRLDAWIEATGAARRYWAALDLPFRRHLVALAGAEAAGPDAAAAERAAWCRVVRDAARDAFEGTAGALDQTARLLRAAVVGRRALYARLAALCPDTAPAQEATP